MQLSDLLLLAPALLGFVILLWARLLRAPSQTTTTQAHVPPNAILVDGSNVMHWGGDASAEVLKRVLKSLENKGHAPIVFFDASAGYRLGDRYYNEAKLAALLGRSANHICVVDKGVVADQAILMFASDYGLRVVTNDKYRDWRVQFPHAAKKGNLIGGEWRDGAVVWRGSL